VTTTARAAVSERVGHVLRPVRSSARRSRLAALPACATITVSSPAFEDGGPIPVRHAGRGVGDNISPELRWSELPAGTAAIVIVLEDDDVPLPRPLWHTAAVVAPDVDHLAEGALHPGADDIVFLKTLLGRRYSGPRPIPGHGVHHYRFHTMAIDRPLDPATTRGRHLVHDIRTKVTARGVLTGTFSR
jgi:phosphatidylethanolamine-binding protein (PEBP) family uncharacterized protein